MLSDVVGRHLVWNFVRCPSMILSIFLVADLNGSYDTKVCRKNLKQILPGVKINFKIYEFLVIVMY